MTSTPINSSSPTFILEENHDLPICQVQVVLRTGAALDSSYSHWPPGLSHYASELMRRGAGGKSRAELDVAFDSLGASLRVRCGYESITFDLVTLKHKLPESLALLADVVLRPDFPQQEADRLKRELVADLDDLRDDDSSLVHRYFSKSLYGSHPYGRPIEGLSSSVSLFTIDQCKDWQSSQIVSGNLIFAAAGDLTLSELQDIAYDHFASLPMGLRQDQIPLEPLPLQGRQLVLINKAERTQSQILIGHLAPRWSEEAWLPLHIATTALGGMFTARLMTEVRVKRGLSYGVSARLGSGRGRQGLIMHVFPAAAQTLPTTELMLKLYEDWAKEGITQEEFVFAKSYLTKSYAFEVQTPESRLRIRTKLNLCHMPEERMVDFTRHVEAVTIEQVQDAMRQYLQPENLLITVVATVENLQKEVERHPLFQTMQLSVLEHDSY